MTQKTSLTFPHLNKEIALHKQGYYFIAGLDEAGRGAWAGPVVAAAVILPFDQPGTVKALSGLRDSKKLTSRQRDDLFSIIQDVTLTWAVGQAPASIVDDINVIGATRQAMQQAITYLTTPPDYLLLDHLKLPAVDLPQDAFSKADNISLTVAAASVMAKVTRDRIMIELQQNYPEYGFERHKGYGTKVHQQALAQYGPCPIHRLSFKPLKQFDYKR